MTDLDPREKNDVAYIFPSDRPPFVVLTLQNGAKATFPSVKAAQEYAKQMFPENIIKVKAYVQH